MMMILCLRRILRLGQLLLKLATLISPAIALGVEDQQVLTQLKFEQRTMKKMSRSCL